MCKMTHLWPCCPATTYQLTKILWLNNTDVLYVCTDDNVIISNISNNSNNNDAG